MIFRGIGFPNDPGFGLEEECLQYEALRIGNEQAITIRGGPGIRSSPIPLSRIGADPRLPVIYPVLSSFSPPLQKKKELKA